MNYDLISRQAVIDIIHLFFTEEVDKIPTKKTEDGEVIIICKAQPLFAMNKTLSRRIKELPSVNPQEPKTGHWKSFTHSAYHGVDDDNEPIWREVKVYHCSECNRRTVIKENYCPNCGSAMKGE